MHPSVHCSIIYNSQDMETSKCPSTEEWIKKNVVHIDDGISLNVNRNKIGSSVEMWMDLETVIQSEEVRKRKTMHIY